MPNLAQIITSINRDKLNKYKLKNPPVASNGIGQVDPNRIDVRMKNYLAHPGLLTPCNDPGIWMNTGKQIGNDSTSIGHGDTYGSDLTTNAVYKCVVKEGNNSDRFYIGSTVNLKANYR